MRWIAYIICSLFSLSLLLGPVSMLHAHVSDHEHEQVGVHGGHSHHLPADHHDHAPADAHHEHASDHVIDLQLDSTQGGSSQPSLS